MPEGRVTDVVATTLGYVALAQLADGPDGTAYHASWLSADGSDWTPIARSVVPAVRGPTS